jgi:parallel beta-helix repeat protein
MIIRIFLSIVSVLFLFSGCGAAHKKGNVYVDAVSGNDRNDGNTPASAIKTLEKLAGFNLDPGDTVYLKSASTWIEELKINGSGKKNKPIVITSYGTGEKPAIDGQMIKKNNLYLYKQSYIEVTNISFSNAIGSGGIRIAYGSGIKISNCEFTVTGHGGIFIENSNDCTISANSIESPAGIRFAQTDGIYCQRNNNITIENNKIILRNNEPDQHIDGIQSYLDKNITIRGNYIFQDNQKSNSQGIYTTNAQGWHIYYNNIVYCPNTLASVIGFRNLDKGYGQLELYNNTLKSRGSNNLYITEAEDVKVMNNIFVTSSPAYIINIKSVIKDRGNSFNHNLYFRQGKGNIVNYPSAGGGMTIEQWQLIGFDSDSFFADPMLDNKLFTKQNSPAIDAGKNIQYVQTDFTGKKRINGRSADIGAVEFTQE